MEINIKLLTEGAQLPSYETMGSAGMDIRADLTNDRRSKEFPGHKSGEYIAIYPGNTERIATGIALEIPMGFEIQVRSRSGAASQGLIVANSPGTIDADYRGEICVLLHNQSRKVRYVYHGDRVAQLILAPVERAMLVPVEELSETRRGDGGFGSTGIT